jgi:DNA repair exonuclease SbcCD nuclease subunit
MRRLGRPCIMIRGNHDAASVITRSLVLPDNLVVLSARRAETHRLEALGVVVHGQSFPNRAVPENLAEAYPAPVMGLFNIGLLHTSAEDPGEHETYAPCSVEALALKGYDYWALGHIHQRQVLHERPWVVFPGNIQGRNPRETGGKGVTLVEVRDRRIVAVSHRDVDVLRWEAAAVDLAGAESVAEIYHRVRLTLAEVFAAAEGRPLIVRLTLRGAGGEHDAIDAECRNAAASVSGDLHIERVRIETKPAASIVAADAIAQLADAFRQAAEDPSIQAQLLADFAALSGQIPRLPGRPAPALPQSAEALRALVPEAWQAVEAVLGGP